MTSIEEGETVTFTDQSANNPTQWSWNFGDGNTSPDQNPTHTFNTANTYTISLTVTNSAGFNIETKTNYITVNAAGMAPVANFTASSTSISEGRSVIFTDISSNEPTSWLWDFGDETTSTEQSPFHIYVTEGFYTISLTVTNSYGSDDEIKTNYISVTTSGYCNATATGEFEYIDGISLGNISNSGTGRSENGYDNYIQNYTILEYGETYPLTIDVGFFRDNDIVGCWIDWNQDFDFKDENESITLSDPGQEVTGGITIPSDALIGSTRMRILVTNSEYNELELCGEHNFGETEDYTVYVNSVTSVSDILTNDALVYPNPNTGAFTIELSDLQNESIQLQIINTNGQSIYHDIKENVLGNYINEVSLDSQPNGIYFVKIVGKEFNIVKKMILY